MSSAQAALQRAATSEAAAIRARERDLATRAVVHALPPTDRTVGAELIARALVARYASAMEAGATHDLTAWADATCERYGGITAVPAVLRAGAAILAAEATHAPFDRERLTEEIDRIASRPRLVRTLAVHVPIDEVDVALEEFVARIENADVLTAEHSRAVSVWCRRVATRMGLEKHDVVRVTRGGLIHDIGKTTTPPEVLNAARRLSDDEMTVMRKHAEEGARIVAGSSTLSPFVPIVRGHHERIDGRGYPDGLVGTAIPLSARIVAVADSFNAMIGRRPYRLPLSPSVALDELTRHRGTQFDPDVVDAMIDVVTAGI